MRAPRVFFGGSEFQHSGAPTPLPRLSRRRGVKQHGSGGWSRPSHKFNLHTRYPLNLKSCRAARQILPPNRPTTPPPINRQRMMAHLVACRDSSRSSRILHRCHYSHRVGHHRNHRCHQHCLHHRRLLRLPVCQPMDCTQVAMCRNHCCHQHCLHHRRLLCLPVCPVCQPMDCTQVAMCGWHGSRVCPSS
jgi:hypothetical protein